MWPKESQSTYGVHQGLYVHARKYVDISYLTLAVLVKEVFKKTKDVIQCIHIAGTKKHQAHVGPCYRQFICILNNFFDKGLILRLGNIEKIGILGWVIRASHLTNKIP